MTKHLMMTTAAAALALGLASASASAETLNEALQQALLTSPELDAQREAVRGLDEGVAQARSGMRPTITGTASVGLTYSDSSENNARTPRRPATIGATVSQPLFDGFQTENAVQSAFRSVESGRYTLFQVEQNVILNAVTAYARVIQAQQNVRLAQNNLSVISRSLDAARDRFDVGEVTRTDVAQAEARQAESRANLVTQQGAMRQALQTYERFVGHAAGKLSPLPPIPELPASLTDAREIAKMRHPSVLAARSNVEAAAYSVKQSKGALLPSVDLTGSISAGSETVNRNSGVISGATAVEVTVPIFQGGVLRSSVRQNQALEDQRYHQLRDVTRQVLEQVGIAWENLETARASSRSNRAQVRAQSIAFEGVQEEAKVGSRTTLDVLDAEQDLLDARVALVRSKTDEHINAYSLLAALGLLSIETLNVDVPRYDPQGPYESSQVFGANYSEEEDAENEEWRKNWAQ